MGKFDISKLKGLAISALASGKRNAPTIMTGGSILLGWAAAYFFWKQGRKAERKIEYEETKLNDGKSPREYPSEATRKLPKKDKAIIYLQYCWTALALGVASTGLAIGANKLAMDRLVEAYMLVKLMDDKNEKQNKIIEKFKEELGDKKVQKIENEIRKEEYPREKFEKDLVTAPGDGRTLFYDRVTGRSFRKDILDVTDGISNFVEDLTSKRRENISKVINDPFFARSDIPFDPPYDRDDNYAASEVRELLERIGELKPGESCRAGELMEFRAFSSTKPFCPKDILIWDEEYVDPSTGQPVLCYLDYESYIYPSYELMEGHMI